MSWLHSLQTVSHIPTQAAQHWTHLCPVWSSIHTFHPLCRFGAVLEDAEVTWSDWQDEHQQV